MRPNEIIKGLTAPVSQEPPARDVTRPACVAKDVGLLPEAGQGW
ncbi:hypothetical protein [Streptomyces sp. NPDC048669]